MLDLTDLDPLLKTEVKEILQVMGDYHLRTPVAESKALIIRWRKLKHSLEMAGKVRFGAAREWLNEIYSTTSWRNFNDVCRKRYRLTDSYKRKQKVLRASPEYKEWRAGYEKARWESQKADPEYRAKKRIADRARYFRKKLEREGSLDIDGLVFESEAPTESTLKT